MGESSSDEIQTETEKAPHESKSKSFTEISSTLEHKTVEQPKPRLILEKPKEVEKRKPSESGISCQVRDPSSIVVRVLNEMKPLNQIRKVPLHFKYIMSQIYVYDPVIVSLGPYYYGMPAYQHAEVFKKVSLAVFVSKSDDINNDKYYFKNKILARIQDVRDCYEEVRWDDDTLAWLMLRDACFLIFRMELASSMLTTEDVTKYYNYFGIGAMNLIGRDMILLENQIPFWIIKLLFYERSNEDRAVWENLLLNYMNHVNLVELKKLPWENEKYELFHLLDAVRYYHMMPVKDLEERNVSTTPTNGVIDIYKDINYQFRSVTNLKEKGIRFKLGDSNGKQGNSISFTSHSMYGQLTLPPLIFSVNFFDIYTNFIAYEIFPTSNAKLYATAFVNFIKSLIETSNDVKILREEGILFSNIGSDEEVVRMIKTLHTFGFERSGVFIELKKSITSHCCSKSKTWKAELIHTYFRSPLTIIAVFAASILLCLALVQTFFTIHPIK